MAQTFIGKFSSNIGTTTANVGNYTPASGGAIVLGLTISNKTINALSANVALHNGTDRFYLTRGAPIPAGGSLVLIGGVQKLVLQQGDHIQVETLSGQGLDAIMSLMETDAVGGGGGGGGGTTYSLGVDYNTGGLTGMNQFGTNSFSVTGANWNNSGYSTLLSESIGTVLTFNVNSGTHTATIVSPGVIGPQIFVQFNDNPGFLYGTDIVSITF